MTRFSPLRRGLLAVALTGLVPGAVAWAATPVSAVGEDMALGSPRARVTVTEYASLGCPHCAAWAREVFPAFRAKYVDTGKVRYVVKEMLYGNSTLAMAGFLMARCAGPARYFDVLDAVYRAQADVARQGNAYGVLSKVAQNAGLTQAQFDACLADQAAIAAVNARQEKAEAAGVNQTPTFFVNGKRVGEGGVTLAQLDAAIAAARRR